MTGDNSTPESGESSVGYVGGRRQIGGLPWGSDHPCYNGHALVTDPMDQCDRCGAEIEQHPNGRWRPLEAGSS